VVRPYELLIKLRLTRSRLVCPKCSYTTRACRDTRTLDSRWRHLDIATSPDVAFVSTKATPVSNSRCNHRGSTICSTSWGVAVYETLRTLSSLDMRQDDRTMKTIDLFGPSAVEVFGPTLTRAA
jgi:hypothetical protein